MDNAAVYTLAALQVAGPVAAQLQMPIVDLAGMTAATLDFEFNYGSGAASGFVKVKTSFDGGTKWRDVARFDFATASKVKHANLDGLLPKGVTEYADLAGEGVYDAVLGDRLVAELTVTGTYVNSSLAVRASVR